MAQPATTPTGIPTEKTFSSYNKEQGKKYAQVRRNYHPSVYQAVLDHHTATGGQLDTIVDVGCGPGTAANSLAVHFAHAIGLDPSEGMIATARSQAGTSSASEPVRFERSTAEEIGANLSPPILDSSVDLITIANAAHWFDLQLFWQRAARVLKPGGSVAIWTSGEARAHPSMPNAAAIQAAMEEYEATKLEPFMLPGNRMVRGGYAELPLPWTVEQPVPELDESTFFRKDWALGEPFVVGEPEVDLDTFEKIMGTGSPYTRWAQAHPEDAGTERDVLKLLRKEIERLLHEAGVEEGKEIIRGAVKGVLLMVKKKV